MSEALASRERRASPLPMTCAEFQLVTPNITKQLIADVADRSLGRPSWALSPHRTLPPAAAVFQGARVAVARISAAATHAARVVACVRLAAGAARKPRPTLPTFPRCPKLGGTVAGSTVLAVVTTTPIQVRRAGTESAVSKSVV
jgi:hypothetical protein